MKKFLTFTLVLALTLTLGYGVALAGKGNNGLYGPHWQFNIIGHPDDTNAIGGDNSNGRAIMVPLDNKRNKNDGFEFICPDDTDVLFVDDEDPTFSLVPAGGARIYFEASDHFEIIDRDATDSNGARILIPSSLGNNPLYDAALCSDCSALNGREKKFCEDKYCSETQDVIAVDVWVRVLGKPNTCMNINGFAYDDYQGLYFWSGRIELARKAGRATWEPVNKIFEVHWCEVEGGECVTDSVELSVFHDVFSEYFWDVLNDGTRLVQVRLYPVTP